MTIPTEAIEAAIHALETEAMRVNSLSDDERYGADNIHPEAQVGDGPLWISGPSNLIVEHALTAALPHIRKQLAQEIREAQAQKMRETPFDPFNTDPIDAGYIAGLHEAARIVEGNQ